MPEPARRRHYSAPPAVFARLLIPMPGLIKHRGVRIVSLEPGDTVAAHARPGDIMIEQRAEGWFLHFISDDGTAESYEDPYDSHTKALWSAKAAAEYQAGGD